MLPRPTLDNAITSISDRDEYKTILDFIYDERDKFMGDFRLAANDFETGKVAGSIAALDELLQILDKSKLSD